MLRAGVVALCLAVASAHADEGARIVQARAGYAGVLPPERWSPIWVTIKPGDSSQTLMLTVDYDQDPTQHAQVGTSVTTTPGQTLTVPLLVCPPENVDRIDITLSGQRKPSRVTFSRFPRDNELPLQQTLKSGALLVASVGLDVPSTLLEPWGGGRVNTTGQFREHAGLLSLQPDDLGQSWASLDGLSVVIVRLNTLEKLPTQTLEALTSWVSGGGRLVLVADSPGSSWQRFTPVGTRLSDTRSMDTPASLASIVRGTGHSVVPSIRGRSITITPGDVQRGWSCGQESGSVERLSVLTGLVAHGPLGGGWVSIAGFDPALVSTQLSDEASVAVWRLILQQAIPENPAGDQSAKESDPYNYWITSGDGPIGAAALRATVDGLCDVPPVSGFVYTLIIVLSALLALAVSVFDFVFLGWRKSRHRSWLTASAWITLSALIAWWLPNVVRRQATTLGRLEVFDVLPTPDGNPGGAWRAGVTSFFASKSTEAPLHRGNHAELDGFWRGVSTVQRYEFDRSGKSPVSMPALPLEQRVSALDGSAAAVFPAADGIPLRQWTLRTLYDQGFSTKAPSARQLKDPASGFVLSGLPAGTHIRLASVRTHEGWQQLQATQDGDKGSAISLQATGAVSRTDPNWTVNRVNNAGGTMPLSTILAGAANSPYAYLMLDGPRRRTPAFDALIQGRGYAVVHILADVPLDLQTPVQHVGHAVAAYRIAVPINTEGTEHP